LLIKGGWHFFSVQKCRPPFSNKIAISDNHLHDNNVNAVDLYQIYQIRLSSFFGIPQKQMTVLLDTSLKDPLHSPNFLLFFIIMLFLGNVHQIRAFDGKLKLKQLKILDSTFMDG
jgi:hypothetical protein